MAVSCYQSQNYKIWKQFTTRGFPLYIHIVLLSISKLQNLKVIHNYVTRGMAYFLVVINHKITKFESNSQPPTSAAMRVNSCYQSQNYKIWKQSTTTSLVKNSITSLLSITKLQNLKVIHNCSLEPLVSLSVVINRKTTKFESNSQLPLIITFTMFRRYQSQNYKIWKQFTTHFLSKLIRVWLLSIIKL